MIEDLRGMTEAELNKLTKAQLLDHILQERTTSKVVKQVGDSRGMTEYVVEHYDYQGKLAGIEETFTTYKEDGSVDVITKVQRDNTGAEIRRTAIHHDHARAWAETAAIEPKAIRASAIASEAPALVEAKKPSVVDRIKSLIKRVTG